MSRMLHHTGSTPPNLTIAHSLKVSNDTAYYDTAKLENRAHTQSHWNISHADISHTMLHLIHTVALRYYHVPLLYTTWYCVLFTIITSCALDATEEQNTWFAKHTLGSQVLAMNIPSSAQVSIDQEAGHIRQIKIMETLPECLHKISISLRAFMEPVYKFIFSPIPHLTRRVPRWVAVCL